MKYRDSEFLLKFLLDLKATGSRNVLKVYPAKNRRNIFDGPDDFFRVLCRKTDRKGIDICKLFKEHRFAFHNRQCGLRTDISEPEHGASVRHYGDRVTLYGKAVRFFPIFMYRKADTGDAGSI